jgi:hypothetical protein
MEKIKFVLLSLVLVTLGALSFRYVSETAIGYRNIMAPPPPAPMEAEAVVREGPFAPPVGEPYANDFWDFEAAANFEHFRKITMSESTKGFDIIPDRCLKCHGSDGPGNFFYGNDKFMGIQDMKTEDGLELHSFPEKGKVPTVMYVYKERHLRKVPFTIGLPYNEYMSRGY